MMIITILSEIVLHKVIIAPNYKLQMLWKSSDENKRRKIKHNSIDKIASCGREC